MKNKYSSGEIVVEASIIVTISMVLITMMLFLGMVFYQQSLATTMANQTAANIAQTYTNTLRDPITGYIDVDNIYQTVTYETMKTDAHIDVMSQKGKVLGLYRMASEALLKTDGTKVEVEVVRKPNELLKSQVVVTVTDSLKIPLIGFFGIDGTFRYSASGRADCYDILEYLNGVQAVGDPSSSNVSVLPNSQTCNVIFIANRNEGSVYATVTVLKGKSILASNEYTGAAFPARPQRTGPVFSRWCMEDGRSLLATTVINSDMVVYGEWAYTVHLDANGGMINYWTGKTTDDFYSVEGRPISLPTVLYRTGYELKGWFTERSGGTQYINGVTPVNSHLTLYAQWDCDHQTYGSLLGWKEVSREGVCAKITITYRCQRCNAEKLGYTTGKCNTNARCNVAHSAGQNFNCTAGGWHRLKVGKYHVTCSKCYGIATSLGTVTVGGHSYQYWYWCGDHGGKNRYETPTH